MVMVNGYARKNTAAHVLRKQTTSAYCLPRGNALLCSS